MKYKLCGKYSKRGSKPVTFRQEIKALTPLGAMNAGRRALYDRGYENILYKLVYKWEGDQWIKVPMMQALELE